MATTFFFRAVASDGKPRTGTLTAENDKLVASELRRQGLVPVYIGLDKKSGGFELKLPAFNSGKRKDVLSSQEREEIKALRREVAQLRRANEILKSASVFFAGELDTHRPK